jgi:phosphate transport system substrate-binding protein
MPPTEQQREDRTDMHDRTRLGAAALGTGLLITALAGVASAQDASGTLDVHGSSTVAPISTAVSEVFHAANQDWGYAVGEEGTGDGFSQFFCVDEGDVADASRVIHEDEAALCAENGVEFVELKIGYDGIAVITSPENPIKCLNKYDLWALFGNESNAITTWQDAQAFAQEMGSTTDFPEGDIAITAPGTESGTYDSFIELALASAAEERGVEPGTRDPVPPTYVGAASDLVIIQGVSQFPTSIGFVGLAYAENAGDAVKILQVDEGEGCIAASPETVADGSYALSRPLFIYPALSRLASNPAIAPWVDFYLSDEGIANVSEVGYVQLPADELQATRDAWSAAKGG